eukprot:351126-Chlamydomonas_euryale.AAC.7
MFWYPHVKGGKDKEQASPFRANDACWDPARCENATYVKQKLMQSGRELWDITNGASQTAQAVEQPSRCVLPRQGRSVCPIAAWITNGPSAAAFAYVTTCMSCSLWCINADARART